MSEIGDVRLDIGVLQAMIDAALAPGVAPTTSCSARAPLLAERRVSLAELERLAADQ